MLPKWVRTLKSVLEKKDCYKQVTQIHENVKIEIAH